MTGNTLRSFTKKKVLARPRPRWVQRRKTVKLANLKERYSTFGLEGSSGKFTSKWELLLVLLVITAGLVITSMAALKAKGNYYNWPIKLCI